MKGIADYVFVENLGEGNHGWFYLATPPSRLPVEDEFVAVKVLMGTPSGDGFQRAVRELRAFAAVDCEHLVTLYDAGQDGGTVYYAMRYYPLGSLAQPIEELSRIERLRAVSHAAWAAHELHEAGLVHRDIKPGNILVDRDGGKLSDLGLAQILNPGMTVSAVGSLRSIEFVDPALLRGDRVSRASDVWSLGVTLHSALTGDGVYPGLPDNDVLLTLRSILKSTPQLHASLEGRERAIISRAIDINPSRRYPTAADLAQDLDSLLPATMTA